MKIEGKRKSLATFFVIVWLPSVVLFALQATGNFADYIQAAFYITVTIACLVVLGTVVKSDDEYYQNLSPLLLLYSVVVGLVMTALSWGLSLQLSGKPPSVNYMLSFVAAPSSVVTTFLSVVLFGLVMPATSEELLKLPLFTELKERYGSRWYGVLVYVGFPVGFWTLLHGIQAYNNPLFMVPAFINGIVLIVFLWKTRCILAVILSHWIYNSGLTLLSFVNGSADLPYGIPLFPDLSRVTVADFAVVLIIVVSVLFFLLPTLRRDR